MWFPIFVPLKLTEILRNLSRFKFYTVTAKSLKYLLSFFVNLKKSDLTLESFKNAHSSIDRFLCNLTTFVRKKLFPIFVCMGLWNKVFESW